jgi:hypothetical protein
MSIKPTNSAGLTAREVNILCAMCQSLKSYYTLRYILTNSVTADRHGEIRHSRRVYHQSQRHYQPEQGLEEGHGRQQQQQVCFA